ncbi:hypothetical protein KM92DES2_10136 [uncultured Desulfovibrio sp.]|uniref:Uncharacterized protein n=1 Tax=uncultured Desulfovibrio sp. TaxID=167968 RepID=A0A212IWB9_9BACT|nr:hypothetical protein KM92DES2_10136 [uncultured Desulfovibrio sp.]
MSNLIKHKIQAKNPNKKQHNGLKNKHKRQITLFLSD